MQSGGVGTPSRGFRHCALSGSYLGKESSGERGWAAHAQKEQLPETSPLRSVRLRCSAWSLKVLGD